MAKEVVCIDTDICSSLDIKYHALFKSDGIGKSRHSRENGNPENSNCLKTLDSCFRRND